MGKQKKRNFFLNLFENVFFTLFVLIIRIFPLSVALFLGKSVALLGRTLLKKRYQQTVKNINMAREAGFLKNIHDSEKLARDVWSNIGIIAGETLYYCSHSRQKMIDNTFIEADGEAKMKQLLTRGKGAILASAHLGNWEIMGGLIASRGIGINAIAKAQNNQFFDRILIENRNKINLKSIPRTSFLRPIMRALSANEIVAFLSDQFDHHGSELEIFGNSTKLPIGAAELAVKTGIPLFFSYIFREGRIHHMYVSDEIIPVNTGNREADTIATANLIIKEMEKAIEQHPDQWLWMHKLWR